ncbi:MAG: PBP1A family penicillin-binding protein [Pseudomonadota bacterium]
MEDKHDDTPSTGTTESKPVTPSATPPATAPVTAPVTPPVPPSATPLGTGALKASDQPEQPLARPHPERNLERPTDGEGTRDNRLNRANEKPAEGPASRVSSSVVPGSTTKDPNLSADNLDRPNRGEPAADHLVDGSTNIDTESAEPPPIVTTPPSRGANGSSRQSSGQPSNHPSSDHPSDPPSDPPRHPSSQGHTQMDLAALDRAALEQATQKYRSEGRSDGLSAIENNAILEQSPEQGPEQSPKQSKGDRPPDDALTPEKSVSPNHNQDNNSGHRNDASMPDLASWAGALSKRLHQVSYTSGSMLKSAFSKVAAKTNKTGTVIARAGGEVRRDVTAGLASLSLGHGAARKKRQKQERVRLARLAGHSPETDGMTSANANETKVSSSAATEVEKTSATKRRGWVTATLIESSFTAISLSFVAASAGLFVAIFILAPEPPKRADLWAVNRLPSVVMMDRNGKEIAARGARYGEAVSVDELPPYLVDAFLATEDRRFYKHHGVDLRGIARAVITNIRAGGITEGGSTITQQLAKNLFLSAEQSYLRKIEEAFLAIWIEGRYSKNEILSLYLNRIYMGAGAYGIESAAKTYFDKSVRDVTLAEAVLLAGLPKAPSALSPTQNPFGAQNRALEVLDNLLETTSISKEQAREAKLNPAKVAPPSQKSGTGYFFDMVHERAKKLVGPDQKDLVIYTTLDQEMQRAAEKAIANAINADAKAAGASQSALVAFDNATGEMRALVGGRSYVESQFNRATMARRQPGSAFKPFVYAAALENGYTPQSRMVDQPIDIAGWKPTNYGDRFDGPMRLTEAMARSVNTIAVQISEEVGRNKVIRLARRLGIASPIPGAEAGIALGGFDATLEELTAAYVPFAGNGVAPPRHAIKRIEDNQANILWEQPPLEETSFVSKKVAKDMTHLMYQVMASGTGKRARLGKRQAVGKTGTTNDWRDAWFIGYTAQITAGIWIGNDNYQPMNRITGGSLPASAWREFMLAAHDGLPLVKLSGAYVADRYEDLDARASFYRTLMSDFQRVERDGRFRASR